MPQTKPIVSIENVVASASVDQKMDLNEITRNCKSFLSNSKKTKKLSSYFTSSNDVTVYHGRSKCVT